METYKTVIEAGKTHRRYLRDIFAYHELFFFLAWRDILVRYKQTAIGVAWSVLRPLLTMLVFTFVFGKIAKLPSGGVPYPILIYSAMLAWQFFANTITEGGNSLIANEKLVSKVYFPRIIIPSTSMIVSLIDFCISFAILGLIMVWFEFAPSSRMIFLPLFLAQAGIFALGMVYFISALNVSYRDFRYVLPFIVQFGLYISPVGFSSAVIPQEWRLIYSLNPMVGVIDGFRWAILGGENQLYMPGLYLSLGLAAAMFIGGFYFFRRMERKFADVI